VFIRTYVSGVGSGVVSEKIMHARFSRTGYRTGHRTGQVFTRWYCPADGPADRPMDASFGPSAGQYHRVNNFSDRPADRP
jgi:hypothetical protein